MNLIDYTNTQKKEKFLDFAVVKNYHHFNFKQFCLGIYQMADTARPYEVCKS